MQFLGQLNPPINKAPTLRRYPFFYPLVNTDSLFGQNSIPLIYPKNFTQMFIRGISKAFITRIAASSSQGTLPGLWSYALDKITGLTAIKNISSGAYIHDPCEISQSCKIEISAPIDYAKYAKIDMSYYRIAAYVALVLNDVITFFNPNSGYLYASAYDLSNPATVGPFESAVENYYSQLVSRGISLDDLILTVNNYKTSQTILAVGFNSTISVTGIVNTLALLVACVIRILDLQLSQVNMILQNGVASNVCPPPTEVKIPPDASSCAPFVTAESCSRFMPDPDLLKVPRYVCNLPTSSRYYNSPPDELVPRAECKDLLKYSPCPEVKCPNCPELTCPEVKCEKCQKCETCPKPPSCPQQSDTDTKNPFWLILLAAGLGYYAHKKGIIRF
jgi:hypothetical protein